MTRLGLKINQLKSEGGSAKCPWGSTGMRPHLGHCQPQAHYWKRFQQGERGKHRKRMLMSYMVYPPVNSLQNNNKWPCLDLNHSNYPKSPGECLQWGERIQKNMCGNILAHQSVHRERKLSHLQLSVRRWLHQAITLSISSFSLIQSDLDFGKNIPLKYHRGLQYTSRHLKLRSSIGIQHIDCMYIAFISPLKTHILCLDFSQAQTSTPRQTRTSPSGTAGLA